MPRVGFRYRGRDYTATDPCAEQKCGAKEYVYWAMHVGTWLAQLAPSVPNIAQQDNYREWLDQYWQIIEHAKHAADVTPYVHHLIVLGKTAKRAAARWNARIDLPNEWGDTVPTAQIPGHMQQHQDKSWWDTIWGGVQDDATGVAGVLGQLGKVLPLIVMLMLLNQVGSFTKMFGGGRR